MSHRDKFSYVSLGVVLGLCLSMLFFVWAFPWFSNPLGSKHVLPYTPSKCPHWPQFDPKDTYAQWIMAAVSIVATGVSVWAVYLVRATLQETRNTTDAAIRSAISAEDANLATQEMLTDSRRVSRVENAAYLFFRNGELAMRHDRIYMQFDVTNEGNSPAIEVGGWGYVRLYISTGENPVVMRIDKTLFSSIPPHGAVTIQISAGDGNEIPLHSKDAIATGNYLADIDLQVGWTDTLGLTQSLGSDFTTKDITLNVDGKNQRDKIIKQLSLVRTKYRREK